VPTWDDVEKWLHKAALNTIQTASTPKQALGDAQVMPISSGSPEVSGSR
jgi:hypothetical protein